ncbi:FKBP-type peptidyl-prolyl cis-trans isomerase [Planomonospora algeriensis]
MKSGQKLMAHYIGKIWGTDKEFDSSWGRGEPATFPIGVGQVVKGWDQTLVGQTVGSRVLVSIPPDLGYGEQGNPQAGIKGTDTLVFLVDIVGAY